ncbi:MAG: hypothetical protein A2Y38_07615 [Spirochaetes bacterium GWB1_59_5]|nr:MAG: hypothetical protein A2Y38_07615 [Spirochaetes bacterium GWB1_59_5]
MMQAALLFVAPMEILKLSMLATFVFKALGLPLPLLAAFLAFLSAVTLGLIMRLAGGRRIWHTLTQLLGLGLALLALYRTGQGSMWDGPVNRYLLPAAVLGGAFWIRGSWLARSTLTHAFCLARFEEGIAVYLGVFFISISVGAGPANALGLSLAFFLCDILALGISKARNAAEGGFSKRQRGAPLALIAGSFLLAAVGLSFVTQELQQSAEKTRVAMKNGALEFIRVLGAVLNRLFTIKRTAATATRDGGDVLYRMAENEPAANGLLAKILFIAFIAILAAVVLTILLVLLVLLVWIPRALRALANERTDSADLSYVPAWLRAFVRSCARLILRVVQPRVSRQKKKTAARAAYARRQACGRAGAPRADLLKQPGNTPSASRSYSPARPETRSSSRRVARCIPTGSPWNASAAPIQQRGNFPKARAHGNPELHPWRDASQQRGGKVMSLNY